MDSKFFIFKKQNSSFSSNKKSLYKEKKLNKSQQKQLKTSVFMKQHLVTIAKKMIIFLKNISIKI